MGTHWSLLGIHGSNFGHILAMFPRLPRPQACIFHTHWHSWVTIWHSWVTTGNSWDTTGHSRATIGQSWVAIAHSWVNVWHSWVTIGHSRVTVCNSWVTTGHSWVTIGLHGPLLSIHGSLLCTAKRTLLQVVTGNRVHDLQKPCEWAWSTHASKFERRIASNGGWKLQTNQWLRATVHHS